MRNLGDAILLEYLKADYQGGVVDLELFHCPDLRPGFDSDFVPEEEALFRRGFFGFHVFWVEDEELDLLIGVVDEVLNGRFDYENYDLELVAFDHFEDILL